MLNQTTISGLMILSWLARAKTDQPVPPREIAEQLGLSPTYAAKITQQMARSGLVQTLRGAQGGVRLVRAPETVTLLEVVVACQGSVAGDHCEATGDGIRACAFHRAMLELQQAVTGVLRKWTLAQMAHECGNAAEDGTVSHETCRLHQLRLLLEIQQQGGDTNDLLEHGSRT